MALILAATSGALVAVLAVGVLVLTGRGGEGQRLVRWSGLVITVLVALVLAPLTVEDSGAAAALVLLGVPVLAAALPALAQQLAARLAGYLDLVAAVAIGGWGLLLALGGLGVAFLPSALLFLAGAVRSLVTGHRAPSGPAPGG
ncbi:hypothetical protein O7626_07745 [Micromonospora sp. WMMD1102]|uniref:hypothetical protein n=1 Tax=Micromonospora sp. WMMD1102 TaxID=3016105 RepID=UPI0024153EA8|nr:hypothetical protein [Micromonospora sp. WMMD1102]MDG4785820.1 hypothetical protein [Micromonospora sp. WMMD1102]